jgi:hypothetical protein
MSQREWRYQMKPFKPLLEKRGATKEDNAYSKRPRKKKERPHKNSEYKIIELNKHRVDVEYLRSSTQARIINEAGELDHPTPKLLENKWSFYGKYFH